MIYGIIICLIPIICLIFLALFNRQEYFFNAGLLPRYCINEKPDFCRYIFEHRVDFGLGTMKLATLGTYYFISVGVLLFIRMKLPYSEMVTRFLLLVTNFGLFFSLFFLVKQLTLFKSWCRYCVAIFLMIAIQTALLDLESTSVISLGIELFINYPIAYIYGGSLLLISILFSHPFNIISYKRNTNQKRKSSFNNEKSKYLKGDVILFKDNQNAPLILILGPYCTYCLWCLERVLDFQKENKANFPIIVRFSTNMFDNTLSYKIPLTLNFLTHSLSDQQKIRVLKEWYAIPNLSFFEKKYNLAGLVNEDDNETESSKWVSELGLEKIPLLITQSGSIGGYNEAEIRRLLTISYKRRSHES